MRPLFGLLLSVLLNRRKGIFGKTNCRLAKNPYETCEWEKGRQWHIFLQLLSRPFAKIDKCCVGCCQIQKGKKLHKNLKKIKWNGENVYPTYSHKIFVFAQNDKKQALSKKVGRIFGISQFRENRQRHSHCSPVPVHGLG